MGSLNPSVDSLLLSSFGWHPALSLHLQCQSRLWTPGNPLRQLLPPYSWDRRFFSSLFSLPRTQTYVFKSTNRDSNGWVLGKYQLWKSQKYPQSKSLLHLWPLPKPTWKFFCRILIWTVQEKKKKKEGELWEIGLENSGFNKVNSVFFVQYFSEPFIC